MIYMRFFLLLILSTRLSTAAAPNMELAKSVFDAQVMGTVKESPIPGIFQFSQGTEIFYISADGRYVMQGEMIDLKNQKNITESFRAAERLKILSNLPKEGMIIIEPPKPHYKVTVFVDINCPYCRLIQEKIHEYERRGITVRYLAFPRGGLNSAEGVILANIWCSAHPLEWLFSAEIERHTAGEAKPCPIIQKHYTAGVLMGITGVPAVLLEDGTLIPGFVAPENLEGILAKHSKNDSRKTASNK